MEIRLSDKVDKPIRIEVTPMYTNIVISCSEGQNAILEQFLSEHNIIHWEDKYDIQIKRKRPRRSKDANAYMWVLADKIANITLATKEEIYRKAIREVGVFQDVAVQREAVGSLVRTWSENGIGWFADVFDSKLEDSVGTPMKRVRLYKGSHTYNSKEMARLIDYIVDECHNLGIVTDTPEEIERMKMLWRE